MKTPNARIWEKLDIDLGQTGVLLEVDAVVSYVVLYFDGTDGTVTLRRTRDDSDPNLIHLYAGMGDKLGPEAKWYVHNSTAQAGKKISLKFGGEGTVPTAGVAGGGATAAKQDSIIAEVQDVEAALSNYAALKSGQKACPTVASEAIGVSQLVPAGMAVAVFASVDNTEDAYVGPSGIDATTGCALAPGQSVALRVTDVNLIHCFATNAGQNVSWVVEIAP